jgi:hypothetical protein
MSDEPQAQPEQGEQPQKPETRNLEDIDWAAERGENQGEQGDRR